jgi:hypothetical protein
MEHKVQRTLLRTDGTREEFAGPLTMTQIDTLIGAQITDTVTLRDMQPLHVMIVDDQAWETLPVIDDSIPGLRHIDLKCVRPLRPINPEATKLYLRQCIPGTTHQIAGDVYICPDSDFG